MAVAQLKTKYSGSLLGISWAVINPLLIMLAVTFVFRLVFKIEINNFPLFALAGIFPWMFFSAALNEVAFSILGQQGLLRQFNLPREIIPLSSVLANFLNFLIGWILMYPLFLFFNHRVISFLPLLCVVMLLNLLFICGLGLIISVLNVFFHDIGHLLGVLLMFWFWVTPIFYSAEMVPQGFRWILDLNPMAIYVVCYREVVFYGRMPGLSLFTAAAGWAVISAISGLLVFSKLENKLLKHI